MKTNEFFPFIHFGWRKMSFHFIQRDFPQDTALVLFTTFTFLIWQKRQTIKCHTYCLYPFCFYRSLLCHLCFLQLIFLQLSEIIMEGWLPLSAFAHNSPQKKSHKSLFSICCLFLDGRSSQPLQPCVVRNSSAACLCTRSSHTVSFSPSIPPPQPYDACCCSRFIHLTSIPPLGSSLASQQGSEYWGWHLLYSREWGERGRKEFSPWLAERLKG